MIRPTPPGAGAIAGGALLAGCVLLASCALLASCGSVGRDYQPPASAPAASWAAPLPPGAVADLSSWWTAYHDPQLERLVAQALTANLDLRIAGARLREARAALGVAQADELPDLVADGSASRSRSLFVTPFGSAKVEGNYFQAGFDASWEVDLFGGTRRAVEAARADLGGIEASQRDVQVSVAAEVVRVYLELASAQQRLSIAAATLDRQQQTRDLIAAQSEAGLVDAAAVSQADAQLSSSQTVLPLLDLARQQAGHRLALLLGEAVPELDEQGGLPGKDRRISAHARGGEGGTPAELFSVAVLPDAIEALSPGLPSQLLRRRPDVAQAERALAGATARYGVAVADLYPSFSLLGGFGFASTQGSSLFTAASQVWSLGASVRWPLLGAGIARIRASISAADARIDQALLRYQQVVLSAFSEVEDALVALSRDRSRAQGLAAALDAHRHALGLVRDRQAHGIDNYIAVLREEMAAFDAEDQYQLGRKAVSLDLVVLAKALGGGWQERAEAAPEAGVGSSR